METYRRVMMNEFPGPDVPLRVGMVVGNYKVERELRVGDIPYYDKCASIVKAGIVGGLSLFKKPILVTGRDNSHLHATWCFTNDKQLSARQLYNEEAIRNCLTDNSICLVKCDNLVNDAIPVKPLNALITLIFYSQIPELLKINYLYEGILI